MPDLPIAVTVGPLTRQCTDSVRRMLIERGRPICSFEAEGDGRAMEEAVLSGHFGAVLDLTLTELAAEMIGVWGGAGPDRLTAAAVRGIPQVIALGGLDLIDDRALTPEENDQLGREIANKASAARGPTIILVPLRGVSPILIQSLRNWLSPNVRIRELDLHVNDPAFAVAAVEALENELRP